MTQGDDYSEKEIAARRDKVLSIMLNTPPKPHVARPQSPPKSRKKADEDDLTSGRKRSDPAS